MICDVMGSHSSVLERAIINAQALGDQTNASVLWPKYDLNINKKRIFGIQLYSMYFFIVKNDHGIFFKGRIMFLLRLKRLPIDTSPTERKTCITYCN